jgi:hypothetical protein
MKPPQAVGLTVKDLKKLLKELPPELPVAAGRDGSVAPVLGVRVKKRVAILIYEPQAKSDQKEVLKP